MGTSKAASFWENDIRLRPDYGDSACHHPNADPTSVCGSLEDTRNSSLEPRSGPTWVRMRCQDRPLASTFGHDTFYSCKDTDNERLLLQNALAAENIVYPCKSMGIWYFGLFDRLYFNPLYTLVYMYTL